MHVHVQMHMYMASECMYNYKGESLGMYNYNVDCVDVHISCLGGIAA